MIAPFLAPEVPEVYSSDRLHGARNNITIAVPARYWRNEGLPPRVSHRRVRKPDSIQKSLGVLNPQVDSRLCQLPNEILALIGEELDPSSLLLWLLSCKLLWALRSSNLLRLMVDQPELMARYFTSVEYQCQDHIPCYLCMKLHWRWLGVAGGEYPNTPKGGRRWCEFKAGEIQLCEHYRFYHKLVLLALRAHKMGPAYGIRLENLAHKCNPQYGFERGFPAYRMHEYISRKIEFSISSYITVDMSLHLRLEWKYRIDLSASMSWVDDPPPKLESLVEDFSSSCCHYAPSFVEVSKRAVYHARNFASASNEGCPCCNQPLDCLYCATTFTIHAAMGRRRLWSKTGHCNVTVTAIKNLGRGGDPRDQPWRGHIRNHGARDEIHQLSPGLGREMVYRTSKVRGRWALPDPYLEGRPHGVQYLQNWDPLGGYCQDKC